MTSEAEERTEPEGGEAPCFAHLLEEEPGDDVSPGAEATSRS